MTGSCPLCGLNAFRPLWRYGGLASGCCEACNHVYTVSSEPVSYESFGQSYDDSFLQATDHPLFDIARHRTGQLEKFISIPRRRVLEVGCGYGHFLKHLQDEGANVSGVEPSSKAWGFARSKFGLSDINNEEFDPASSISDQVFDVVAAFHMLEHTKQPADYIKAWANILNPGGFLAIAVPNLYTLHRDLHELYFIARGWHRHCFTPEKLHDLVVQAGLSVVLVEDEPESTMSPSSMLMIAEKNRAFSACESPTKRQNACKILEDFHKDLDALCQSISRWVTSRSEQGSCIAIFGAGLHTEALLELCSLDAHQVSYLLDDDETKWNQEVCGVRVVGSQDARLEEVDCILVSSLAAENNILDRLRSKYPLVETVGIYADLAENLGLN